MIYKIKFEKRAFNELNRLDQIISRRILKSIKELEDNFQYKDIKRLKGKEIYRLSGIDSWFLHKMKNIHSQENLLSRLKQ